MESEDNTTVIRRLSDFDNYLARHSRNRNLLSVEHATVVKRQREADLIVANGQITDLQLKITSQDTSYKRAKLDYEAQTNEAKMQLRLAKEKEDSAREQLCVVYERELECRKQLAELRAEFDGSKFAYEKKLSSFEKETCNLKSTLETQISCLQQETSELKHELEREVSVSIDLQSDLEACQENLLTANKQIEELKAQAKRADDEISEKTVLEEKIKELEKKLSNIEDSVELVPILNSEIARLKICGKENVELREENRILRLRDENILLLKEELDSCKKINEAREANCSMVHQFQYECEELRLQIMSWESLTQICAEKEYSGSKSKAVSREIARLQHQERTLLEQVGQLTSENQTLLKRVQEVEEKLNKAKDEEQRSAMCLKQSSDNIRHLRRKLLLVAKERDMSRMLLDNYEKETTVVGAQQDGERLQRMESILDGYKKDNETLETELRHAREHLQSFGHHQGFEVALEREQFEARIKQLQKQNCDLELLTTRLKEEKHIADMKLANSSFQDGLMPDLRRIHSVSNPVQWMREQREQHLESVTKENEALRQRVKVLEEAEGRMADLTLQVEERLKEAPTEKDIKDLQTKLTAAENKNTRQIDLFKQLSKEFRESTCTLLGYNISQPHTNQYKLSNMYANSSEEYLLFAKSDDGELQLLETPYSTVHGENIDLYLHTHHSIPAFLSNLTLELFKSQTSSMAEANQ